MAGPKTGPLAGSLVIEMAGLGPVPLAGLMLAEMGARVVRIERPRRHRDFLTLPPQANVDVHGRDLLTVDVKSEEGRTLLLDLIGQADVLMEGFRPGVMEKLGLGPDDCAARNERLVYARMTGFGQDGPLAHRAGHDLTYLAYTGVLHAIGHAGERPVPPLNLVADYGGGTMVMLLGILSALLERGRSGKGQVVDAAMLDGVSMLATPFFAFIAGGWWNEQRGANLLDSGAPFYDTYETADAKHVAVACLEPQFFAAFCALIDLEPRFSEAQYDRGLWPDMRAAIAAKLKMKTRDEWATLFEPTDACVAPVLTFAEAPDHPHNRARTAHSTRDGFTRPEPTPRLSRTPATRAGLPDTNARTILQSLGIDAKRIDHLTQNGTVAKE